MPLLSPLLLLLACGSDPPLDQPAAPPEPIDFSAEVGFTPPPVAPAAPPPDADPCMVSCLGAQIDGVAAEPALRAGCERDCGLDGREAVLDPADPAEEGGAPEELSPPIP